MQFDKVKVKFDQDEAEALSYALFRFVNHYHRPEGWVVKSRRSRVWIAIVDRALIRLDKKIAERKLKFTISFDFIEAASIVELYKEGVVILEGDELKIQMLQRCIATLDQKTI